MMHDDFLKEDGSRTLTLGDYQVLHDAAYEGFKAMCTKHVALKKLLLNMGKGIKGVTYLDDIPLHKDDIAVLVRSSEAQLKVMVDVLNQRFGDDRYKMPT